jgi:ketosteroid isomerase-like protein
MIGAYLARRALLKAFDAMNRHDLPTFMSAWHEQGSFVYPGEIPESGVFEGKSAVEAWFRRFFEQFPKIEFDVQDVCVRNIMDLVGNNVAAVHWNIRLTNRDGRIGENSGVTVLTIKGGKVLSARDFIFDLGENFHRNWSAAPGRPTA